MDKKISPDQKKVLEKFLEQYKKMDSNFEEIFSIFGIGVVDSKLFDGCYGLIDFCVEILSLLVDDKDDWINWYIYDNECGKKEGEAGYDRNLKKICSLEDLVFLIEESHNRPNSAPEVETNFSKHGKETKESEKTEEVNNEKE